MLATWSLQHLGEPGRTPGLAVTVFSDRSLPLGFWTVYGTSVFRKEKVSAVSLQAREAEGAGEASGQVSREYGSPASAGVTALLTPHAFFPF